jgi:hypothetical protein
MVRAHFQQIRADHLTNPLAPAACIVATFQSFARFEPPIERLERALLRIRTPFPALVSRIFSRINA